TSWGTYNSASGSSSTSWGTYNSAAGDYSTSWGRYNSASGNASTAWGDATTASGSYSTAWGRFLEAPSYMETALGTYAETYTPNSATSWQAADRLFVIGNGGSDSQRKNALTVLKNGNTGIGISSPTALLHTYSTATSGGNVLFEGSSKSTPGSPPASGSGTRMMWYPDKAAFRAGEIYGNYWDKDSIGIYSFAVGVNTTANGEGAVAMGGNTKASGNYSTAFGESAIASGYASVAGGSAWATATSSTAFGIGRASGFASAAFGNVTLASGYCSSSWGELTTASGSHSNAFGYYSEAPSYGETVIGTWNATYTPASATSWQASDRAFGVGIGSGPSARKNALTILKSGNTGIGTATPVALLQTYGTSTGGGNVLFSGLYKSSSPGDPPVSGSGTRLMWYPDKAAFRVGYVGASQWDKASIGNYSLAAGYNTTASGSIAVALGSSNEASGDYSTAFGVSNTASGNYSTATGYSTTASGRYSLSAGSNTTAPSAYEVAVGLYNETYSPTSSTGYSASDRVFVVGNGLNSSSRSNALTILKNGNIGIGISDPGSNRLYVKYSSANPTAFIENTNSNGIGLKVETNSSDGTILVSQKSTGYSLRCDSWNPSWHVAFIVKGDNVGIGTSTPSYQLQLSTNSAAKPTSSSWTISSDIRLKDVSGNYDKGLAELLQLQPIVYRYKKDNPLGIVETDKDAYGFSAQEVQKVFPEAVGEKEGYLNLDMHPLLVAQVNAIRELNEKIEAQQKQIERLVDELKEMKNGQKSSQ
ncbi:MAG: tail fiber domain-containing protein, partial [Bacteroidales bacterium]|nr:tail fiber domain-containing protein [Bacteroidales bacterium]